MCIASHRGPTVHGGHFWFKGDTLPDGSTEDCAFTLHDFATIRGKGMDENPYPHGLNDIDNISNTLGIPWEPSKDIPFSYTSTFIGFMWDLDKHTVTLAEPKRHKSLAALQEWASKRAHNLHEAQMLLSKLTHASQIFPKGCPYLTNLETMLTIFGPKPFIPHMPPKGSQDDITWWTRHLAEQAPPCPHTYAPHTH